MWPRGRRTDLYQTSRFSKSFTGYSGEVKIRPEREGDVKHSAGGHFPGERSIWVQAQGGFEEGPDANRGMDRSRELEPQLGKPATWPRFRLNSSVHSLAVNC